MANRLEGKVNGRPVTIRDDGWVLVNKELIGIKQCDSDPKRWYNKDLQEIEELYGKSIGEVLIHMKYV